MDAVSTLFKLHCFVFQFVLAVGLDERKFHLVGLSMGGFVAGVFATKYPSLLSSLVLMCPAGINAPRISDFLMEIASGGKNYLLPKNPEDFRFMMKKVSHRNVFMPFFVVKIVCEARKQANDFYEKGKKNTTIQMAVDSFSLHQVESFFCGER